MATLTAAEKIREELAKPFDDSVLQKRSKGGANLTYVPVAEVIARLNLVLGTENWAEVESETWISSEFPNSMVSKVTISATIDGVTTTKIGYGGEDIKFYKAGSPNEGKPLDLGDSYKGAHSDAFKKACTELGVGLDIARKDDALYHEEAEKQRLADDAAPEADEGDLATIQAAIDSMSDEEKKAFGGWYRENIPYKLSSGRLTTVHATKILQKIAEG